MKLFGKKEDPILTATKQLKGGIDAMITAMMININTPNGDKYRATVDRYTYISDELSLIITELEA